MAHKNTDKKVLVLAAGGTGGHMFPALALGQEMAARGWTVRFLTDARGKRYLKDSLPSTVILAGTPSAPGLKKLWHMFKLAIGLIQSMVLLCRIKADVVVGFGGYPCVPATVAGHILKRQVFLHEQNSVLGRANRFLSRYAKLIATSFQKTEPEQSTFAQKYTWVGNPVRADIQNLSNTPYPHLTLDTPLKVFVMGGSQGSKVFSDVIPEAVKNLPEALQARLYITQQCRPEDIDAATQAYEDARAKTNLKTFFDDVPNHLENCHLVICRAGASTVAEITVSGRPAIFVPFPQALDDHQHKNALTVEGAGGGWVVEQDAFTPEVLATKLETIANMPQTLKQMADKAKECGKPQAAAELADLIEEHKSGMLTNLANSENSDPTSNEAA